MDSPGKNRCNRCRSLMHSLALVFVFAIHPVVILAGGVDRATAETVARNFYLAVSETQGEAIRKDASAAIELELAHQEYLMPDQEEPGIRKSLRLPLYYIFNVLDEKGFVIVSGNEQVKPVLGYAMTGAFRKSHQSPAYQAWMKSCKEQILYVLEHGSGTNRGILEEWEKWKRETLQTEGLSDGQPQCCGILPLLSTRWNQGCLYNADCPVDSAGPCDRAYAGCSAVAMAQVLKYWKHPDTCRRLEGYCDQENRDTDWNVIPHSNYGWIEADLPCAYDWSVMPDELNDRSTPREIDEVSRLLFHCGVSLQMNYGPEGSPANSAAIPAALTDWFGYSPSLQYLRRQNFNPDAWKNLLKVEIDAGRPVLYFGEGNKGGHAFVCDGYDPHGYFHINWGWGGADDGYYCLDALVPGSTCLTDAQRVIIGICPESRTIDPCETIIPIYGVELPHKQSFKGGNEGAWSNYLCGWSTPGREQVYSIVAPSTGFFGLVVTSAEGYVDCAWKEKECRTGGWNCIGDICTTGIYGQMAWSEGETYYILVDDEDTTAGIFEFYIEAQVPTGSDPLTCADQMNLLYHPDSHLITIETDQPSILSVALYALNGATLFSQKYMEVPGQFDVSFLPEGVYILTINSKDFVTTRKIVRW